MIFLSRRLIEQINNEAETAYPAECCGLLVGQHQADKTVVTRAIPSANVVQDGGQDGGQDKVNDKFEVDPKLRFDLMRQLENSDDSIIGHYHSHPDHPAIPSKHDLEMASEPKLIWLITSVMDGKAKQSAAYLLNKDNKEFTKLELAN